MGRTRAGILEGALRCVARHGVRRTTMAEVADASGIAKATLYNHFRRKDDVLGALLDDQLDDVLAQSRLLAGDDLASALVSAASLVAEHPALRRVAAHEPDLAAVCAAPALAGVSSVWDGVRLRVAELLRVGGVPEAEEDGSVELTLRWLASHVIAPSTPELRSAAAGVLAAGLRIATGPAVDQSVDVASTH